MQSPLTLLGDLGDSLKALATSQRLSFSPSSSGYAPSSVWLGSYPSGAKKDYGALSGDPLQNYVIAAAVNAVALALPDAPPYLENLRDGRWVRVDDHPVLGFLRQPHEDLDDADVWSLTSLYRLTRGEAFWIIHLSDAGFPTEAVPYDPRRVRVLGTSDQLISGYEVTTEDGRLLLFPKAQVLHFRHLPDPNNPRRGWTPLSTGSRHLVGSNAASTYHTALLLNGAVSSWLISMRDAGAGNVTPEQFQTFIENRVPRFVEAVGNRVVCLYVHDPAVSIPLASKRTRAYDLTFATPELLWQLPETATYCGVDENTLFVACGSKLYSTDGQKAPTFVHDFGAPITTASQTFVGLANGQIWKRTSAGWLLVHTRPSAIGGATSWSAGTPGEAQTEEPRGIIAANGPWLDGERKNGTWYNERELGVPLDKPGKSVQRICALDHFSLTVTAPAGTDDAARLPQKDERLLIGTANGGLLFIYQRSLLSEKDGAISVSHDGTPRLFPFPKRL